MFNSPMGRRAVRHSQLPNSQPANKVIEAIGAKAALVSQAATQVSLRIAQFEKHLAGLPGRVEAIAMGVHPDNEGDASNGNELELALKLHRAGKDWIISCGSYCINVNEDPDRPIIWTPLADAPLKIKMAALPIFPDLLNAIEKSQDKLIEEISKVSAQYDAFAKSLNLSTAQGVLPFCPPKEEQHPVQLTAGQIAAAARIVPPPSDTTNVGRRGERVRASDAKVLRERELDRVPSYKDDALREREMARVSDKDVRKVIDEEGK